MDEWEPSITRHPLGLPYGKIYVFGWAKEGSEFFPDVLVYDTGFRAVEATGKLSTRWGELKAKHSGKN